MRTIRRLYLYTVAFISAEVVLWGVINLGRSAFDADRVGGSVSQLASALSLLLVGIPVFLLHWWVIQRSLPDDPAERFAGVRAVFLYGILTALLLPVAQNTLAIVERVFFLIFDLDLFQAAVGAGQSFLDNGIALLIKNGLLAAYFFSVLKADWREIPAGDAYPNIRRLFRYLWVVYGLVVLVVGLFETLLFIFQTLSGDAGNRTVLANGLSFIVVGAPIWAGAWWWVQRSITEPEEREATIRVVVLYILSLFGVGTVLVAVQTMLQDTLSNIFLGSFSLTVFLADGGEALAITIPLTLMWVYYGQILQADRETLQDAPRRMGLRRLYYYILVAFGLAATLFAVDALVGFLLNAIRVDTARIFPREQLYASLATLIVGLPLWLRTWVPMAREAAAEDEAGDHARRSVVRKSYLYLTLFAGIVGVMVSAGAIFFELFRALLGDPSTDLGFELLQSGKTLLIFGVLLLYHWQALRSDNSRVQRVLDELHGQFPVLVLAPEAGDFADEIVNILQDEVPSIPVAVFEAQQGAPGDTLSEASAVILPASLATSPPEALRLWLQSFDGTRLVVPNPVQGWVWVDGEGENFGAQTAQLVRQLAEGRDPHAAKRFPAWLILLAVMGGIVALLFLIGIIGEIVGL